MDKNKRSYNVLEEINERVKKARNCNISLYNLDPGHAPRSWKDEERLNDDNGMTWSK